MARTEWLVEHRELEYLRTAASCHPRHPVSQGTLRRRRRRAAARWIKYRQVAHLRRMT
jgi:hypothetical protein